MSSHRCGPPGRSSRASPSPHRALTTCSFPRGQRWARNTRDWSSTPPWTREAPCTLWCAPCQPPAGTNPRRPWSRSSTRRSATTVRIPRSRPPPSWRRATSRRNGNRSGTPSCRDQNTSRISSQRTTPQPARDITRRITSRWSGSPPRTCVRPSFPISWAAHPRLSTERPAGR